MLHTLHDVAHFAVHLRLLSLPSAYEAAFLCLHYAWPLKWSHESTYHETHCHSIPPMHDTGFAVEIRICGKQTQANALAGYKSSLVDVILQKVTPHVPVSAPAVKPSHQMQQALVNLNLAAAKLLSRFLPAQASAEGEEEEEWRARLLDYYTGIMKAGQVLPSR